MTKVAKFVFVVFLSLQFVGTTAYAQQGDVPNPSGTRRQMATIVFSGLAGAILGLSTLSFYGRPQDRLSNIAVGFALGIMAGAVRVTYGATTNPEEFYGRDYGYYQPEDLIFSENQYRDYKTRKTSTGPSFQMTLLKYDF